MEEAKYDKHYLKMNVIDFQNSRDWNHSLRLVFTRAPLVLSLSSVVLLLKSDARFRSERVDRVL